MSAATPKKRFSLRNVRWRNRQGKDDDIEQNGVAMQQTNGYANGSIAKVPPRRHDILSRDGYDFTDKLKEDLIFASTQHHVTFEFNGNTLEGLAKYNDATLYGITAEKEKDLVRKEIGRLVTAATTNDAFLFHSDLQFDPSPETAFQELSDLADQIKCAMGIIRLDNASISIQHCTNELQDTLHNFRHARSRLIGRFEPTNRVRGSGPKMLSPNSRNTALYHALVDYMTASVARTLVRTAVSDYWNKHTLSCLASCTVKIKVLGYDLEKSAEKSISNAEHALQEMNELHDSKESYLVKIRPAPYEEVKEVDTLDTETDTSRRYHDEKTIFNKRVWGLMRQILYSLLRSESQTTAPDCFQAHTTVYKAGLDSSQKILSIGRLGEIDSSAEPLVLRNSFTSMELMIRNAQKIEGNRGNVPKNAANAQPSGTTIECEWVNANAQKPPWKATLQNCVIDEILSIIVPLSLSAPSSSISLAMMLSMASNSTDEEDPILQFERPPEAFTCFMTLTTGKWKDKEHRTLRRKDREVISLAGKGMRYSIRAETALPDSHLSAPQEKTNWNHEARTAAIFKSYQLHSPLMRAWTIAEDSITFDCHVYVSVCVTLALLIVLAGIAIPFVVRDRIKGVDPFQITLFTWMLAGFVILVAKGRYVNEWPWHEFIHGHVICRSLKEVCDATKIDDQTVLMYLLLNEWRNILYTRGPHNGMFSRRAPNGSGGFAITRPVHLSTMMASGFIIVKVLNLFGEHLVCFDTRRGSGGITIRGVGKHLVHLELEDSEEVAGDEPGSARKEKAPRGDQIKRLEVHEIIVDRILGAYVGEACFG